MADRFLNMTVADVQERVRAIDAEKNDDEAAHSKEDDLWEDVLKAIVVGAKDPAALAEAALATKAIEFSRWCA